MDLMDMGEILLLTMIAIAAYLIGYWYLVLG